MLSDLSDVDDKRVCRELFLELILNVFPFLCTFYCSEFVVWVSVGVDLVLSVCVVADICGAFSLCVSMECCGVGCSVVCVHCHGVDVFLIVLVVEVLFK